MSWFSRCSWCGCLFNGGNCRQCTNAVNLSTHTLEPSRHFNPICYDDDDDDDEEEKTIPLHDIISQLPPSVVITTSLPVLPIQDSEDSLIMGNEKLSTILEKESDEFKKSSVEDFVPIPNESEDTSGSDSECDLSSCDDFSPINVPEGKFVTFSNPFSTQMTILPLVMMSHHPMKIDVNPLFNEVLENIVNKDSYEPDLLATPISNANEDECFDPGDDADEIKLLIYHDPSTPKISIASILEGFTNELPLEEMTIYLIWNLKRMNVRRICTMLQLMI
nr:hypothetical protein [Tanacetum cinerariifolium]